MMLISWLISWLIYNSIVSIPIKHLLAQRNITLHSDDHLLSWNSKYNATWNNTPVLFISYGEVPLYLRANIEITTLRNDVIVISDSPYFLSHKPLNPRLKIANLKEYNESASNFSKIYKSKLVDIEHFDARHHHYIFEVHCFHRWFVLRDYMVKNNLSRVFYSDSDSVLFTNVSESFTYRNSCSAVINIPSQDSLYYWVGGGESSYWTLDALDDYLHFTESIYATKDYILDEKAKTTNIVDMTLLWLWWVSHFDYPTVNTTWDSGRPYLNEGKFNETFNLTKSLDLVSVNRNLTLCNGMNVVNERYYRAVFDHRHGFNKEGFGFDYEYGVPYIIGIALPDGGIPETFHPKLIKSLHRFRLYLNNLHYQGTGGKSKMLKSMCHYIMKIVFESHRPRAKIYD